MDATITRDAGTVRRHLPWLWGLARRLVGHAAAEDLVRDSLERAHEAADHGAGRLPDRAWLRAQLIACLRLRWPSGPLVPLPRQLTAPRSVAVTAAAAAALRARDADVEALLDQLPFAARAAVVLVHGEAMRVSAVAAALGVEVEQVHARLDQGQLLLSQAALDA